MTNEEEIVKNVIENSYINGIHQKQDKNIALTGFHQDFIMFVLENETNLVKVSLDDWFPRLEEMKKQYPDISRYVKWRNYLRIP
jgi:hypothetical protein